MKAALCKSLDGPDAIVVEDIADPAAPGPGEAQVRVRVAALNFLDTLIVRGKYQQKPPLPFSPASEFAGVVETVGPGVTHVKPGDRVFSFGQIGAAREKINASAATLVPIPNGVTDEVAAGIAVTYGTGYYGLKDRAQLKAGETLAVLGASGGAGLAAVELGKIMGAKVIACASSDEKLAVCKQTRRRRAGELCRSATCARRSRPRQAATASTWSTTASAAPMPSRPSAPWPGTGASP